MSSTSKSGRAKTFADRLGQLGFGGAPIGNLYHAVDDDRAAATIAAACAAGIRWFDTAPFYGFGLSERRLGVALDGSDQYVSTKVGRLLDADDTVVDDRERFGFHSTERYSPRFDYSGDGILRSIDESCARLKASRLEIAFIHDIGVATHGQANPSFMQQLATGGLKALADLKVSGVIGHVGVGVNDTAAAEDLIGTGQIDVVMLAGRYTLLEHAASATFLARCAKENVAVVLGGPFNSGILAGGLSRYNYQDAPVAIVDRVNALRMAAARFDVPLAAAALQFCLANPAVASVVAGFSAPHEVDEAVANAACVIPVEFWRSLVDQRLIAEDISVPEPVST